MGALHDLYVAIFEDRCADEAALAGLLNEHMQFVHFKKGDRIIPVSNQEMCCYLIFEGRYAEFNYTADGGKTMLASWNAPQQVGVVPLVLRHMYSNADMVATCKTKAVKVDAGYFYSQLEEDGRLGLLLLHNVAHKLVGVARKARRRASFTAADNLRLYLHEEWVRGGAPKDGFCFVLSKRLISEELNISERTVYRALEELKQEEAITAGSAGQIHMNAAQLRENAAFYEDAL